MTKRDPPPNTSAHAVQKPKRKIGRPSIFTQELASEICTRLSMGETLLHILTDAGMPDYATVWRWEQADEEFCKMVAHARLRGTHAIADEAVRIADDKSIDPAHKRVMVETRLKLLGKWNRKDFGDKVALVGGDKDDRPIQHELDLTRLTDAELAEADRLAAKLGVPGHSGADREGEGSAED